MSFAPNYLVYSYTTDHGDAEDDDQKGERVEVDDDVSRHIWPRFTTL